MRPHSKLILSLGFIALGLLGCLTARNNESAPAPSAVKSASIDHGREIFVQNCNGCHPGGNAGKGPSLNDKSIPGFFIRRQVRWGFGPMPSFSKKEISNADLDAVVEFLKSQRERKSAG